MPFSVTYNEQAGFIHVIHEGELDTPSLRALLAAAGQAVKEHNCFLILSDYSKAKLALSIADLYEVPKLIAERSKEIGVSANRIKRALVIPAQSYEKFRFFETVSLNNSQTVRIFNDVDAAREWLLQT